jgi:hypothetical protein
LNRAAVEMESNYRFSAVQAGNLLNLAPIDLSAVSLPAVGVPPLDVPGLLGVQFLGFSIANFSSTTNADLSVSAMTQRASHSSYSFQLYAPEE